MNKQEFVDDVASRTRGTKSDAAAAVDAVFDSIREALASGGSVNIIGFGKFEAKQRAAREGRNPATGAPMTVPAKKVPVFRAGTALKEAVAG